MCGKQGANHDSSREQCQSWPSRSIFNGRNPNTSPLNTTLSQTCKFNSGYGGDTEHEMVEQLKEVLFKDMFLSRKKYLTLRTMGRHNFYASIEEWDCVVNVNTNSVVITMMYCTFQRILGNIIRQLVHHVLLRLAQSVTGFGGVA